MPLLDHFRPPVIEDVPWESFHSAWTTHLADALNELMPSQYIATEHRHTGTHREIDIATFERPPASYVTMPTIFPDAFEVRVISSHYGRVLVAAIELVSPGNKDRPDERTAFAAKCASYLHRGVSLIVVDLVTIHHFNQHNELLRLMNADPGLQLPAEAHLYAVAYRPVLREKRPELDLWPTTFQLGDTLPLLPLRLTGDLFVPVDFETTYQETCRRRRLA